MSSDDNAAHGQLPAAVLWDMDGTLVDTEPYWFASERDLVEEFGHVWPDHRAHAMVGFALVDAAAYMQEHGHVDLPAEQIVNRLLDGVIARLHRRIPWQPGARELLADLNRAGVPCALVTMSWRRFVDPVIAALPDRSFVAAITGDEVPEGKGKPDPEPYLRGASACGADPQDCVAIEDSPTGVRSALQAGCRVIGVPNIVALEPEPGLTLIDSLGDLRVDDLLFRDPPVGATGRGGLQFGRRPMLVIAVLITLAAVIGFAATRGEDDGPPPLPPGAVAIDVWAPYWTLVDTLGDVEGRFSELREVSPFWFGARGVSSIAIDENSSPQLADSFLARARNSSVRIVPSIRDETSAGVMAAILADPASRTQHVAAIVEFAERLDADGIDLDYEQFAFADGSATWATTSPNWVAFVAELGGELHDDGRTLTVSIPPVYDVAATGDRGYWVYDHGAIAEHVDAIRIMAYDYSVAEPGPIAPLTWVQDSVDGTSIAVPERYHHKLVLGVPSYGTNWVVSTAGVCPASAEGRTGVTARSVEDLAARRGGVPAFDPATGEWSFAYSLTVDDGTTACVQNRTVGWVDAEGVAARVEIARRAGWGGVALWALGYEDAEVWQSLVTASHSPIPATPPG